MNRTRHSAADRAQTSAADRGDGAGAAALTEARRLAALHGYQLLDTPPDPELDAIVRIAAAVAGVPTATVNLIDSARQCQLSAVGFDGATSQRQESMCARNIGVPGVVHVRDASLDPRYLDSSWVDGRMAEVRFYASAPLVTPEGHHLGSLCVFDVEPRELDDDQLARLADLATLVMALLERHRRNREQQQLVAEVEEQRELLQLTLSELEARDEFAQALMDTVDVGVVACDADGHLTVFNRVAQGFHGLDLDTALPPAQHASTYHLYAADGVTLLSAQQVPLLRALVEGSVTGVEMVIARVGADPVRVSVSGRALSSESGEAIGAVVAIQDITEERARMRALEDAGEQLRRQGLELADAVAELRRSNTELADLAAVASHDLASPLTAILGYLDLVLDVHGSQLPAEGQAWIATALRAGQRMQRLIEAVLDHARAGSTAFAAQPVDVEALLCQVVEDLTPAAAEADVTFSGGGHALADPVLLRQLLQNLVGNALRYRSPQRRCRIQVRVRDLDHGGWELAVLDNGRGIPAHQRGEVFRMFAMANPVAGTQTEAGGVRRVGHGIGLATCQRIVERHGGRILAEETPGGGATLRATFPSTPPPGALR
ncbi:MAG: GAF domain-containing sensor histidine kinase [Janthinobacterium lividum]